MAVIAGLMDAWDRARRGEYASIPAAMLRWTISVRDCGSCLVARGAGCFRSGRRSRLTLALVTAMGPLLYRIAYQPVAEATVLVLLIVSVAVHFVLTGMGLLFFGAEGSRTPAVLTESFEDRRRHGQRAKPPRRRTSLALIAALSLFFGRTLYGKALRATALNRVGARLCGVPPDLAGAKTPDFATLGTQAAFWELRGHKRKYRCKHSSPPSSPSP